MEIKLKIRVEGNEWKPLTALIDSGTEDSFVSWLIVKEYDLLSTGNGPGTFKTILGYKNVVFGTIEPVVKIIDIIGRSKTEKVRLRIIDMPGVNVILGWLWLEKANLQINFKT